MSRTRRHSVFVGLLACLPVAVLGTAPAVTGRVADAVSFRSDPAWVAGPQLQRGVKVRVTGSAQGQLSPGTSVPVAIRLRNPNSHSVLTNRIRVAIDEIAAPNADAAHPCTTADFAVRQMPRDTFRLQAKDTTDLGALGVPVAAWPWLSMLNRSVNQDGCKGAQLTLTFKARGLHR